MCGIVGICGQEPVDPQALSAATSRLGHRGPDGSGLFVDRSGGTGLGHRRLSIIDPGPGGAQPMSGAGGRHTISFNGEIYNFRPLKAELAALGHTFRTASDTEVILAGYAQWGEAVLDRLNGIFAFAIHDAATGEVFVARDQLGVKPLYYVETALAVAFASEIKALYDLADIPRTPDPTAIRRYLTFLWCPGERTPLAAVKKLEPGCAMVLRDGRVARRWTYWTPPAYAPRRDWRARDCAAELGRLIDTCVERQMVADVPVGAFLSGGLDSGAVVAAAKRVAPDLECFTIDIGQVEEGATDDLPYARQVAAHLQLRLHEVRVDAETLCDGAMRMVEILDEPLADPACLNVLFISELARGHGLKVLLSGTGGDDLFAGYRRHSLLAWDPAFAAIPAPIRGLAGRAAAAAPRAGALGRRAGKLLASLGQEGDRRIEGTFLWGPLDMTQGLLSRDLFGAAPDDVFEPFDDLLAGQPGLSALEKCLALERRFFLGDHNLIYTDKMAMAAGVEVRVPLLDLEMLDFAARTPTQWKHRGLTTKWILKQSQTGVLPHHIINRPKTGFGAPLRDWMKHGMRDWSEELLSPQTVKSRGLFEPAAVSALKQANLEGRVDGAYTLFSLMCIELWCRRFIDSPPSGCEPVAQ